MFLICSHMLLTLGCEQEVMAQRAAEAQARAERRAQELEMKRKQRQQVHSLVPCTCLSAYMCVHARACVHARMGIDVGVLYVNTVCKCAYGCLCIRVCTYLHILHCFRFAKVRM